MVFDPHVAVGTGLLPDINQGKMDAAKIQEKIKKYEDMQAITGNRNYNGLPNQSNTQSFIS